MTLLFFLKPLWSDGAEITAGAFLITQGVKKKKEYQIERVGKVITAKEILKVRTDLIEQDDEELFLMLMDDI